MILDTCLIWTDKGKCTFSLAEEAETLHEEDGQGSPKWPLPSEWLWLDKDNQNHSRECQLFFDRF